MPLTRIDSAFLDLDAIGGIDFDVNNNVPTFKVDATTHRVGIGHNSPETQLHMLGSYPTLKIQNSNTTQYASASIALQGPAGDERYTKILHGNSNTGGTETYFQIEQYNASGAYVKQIAHYSYEYDYWAFSTGATGTEKLRINSDGKVGIGTVNPNYLLDAYQSTGTDQDVFSVRGQTSGFLVQCSDLSAANPEWRLRTFALEDLVFSPGGTGAAGEKVRIKASNGNVGIGTNSPSAKLHVDGGDLYVNSLDGSEVDIKLGIHATHSNFGVIKNVRASDSQNYLSFNIHQGFGGYGLYEALQIHYDEGLYVRGFKSYDTTAYTGNVAHVLFGDQERRFADIVVESESASSRLGAFVFKTKGSVGAMPQERLRITSAGNVGIGTNNPSGKLHVSDGANGLEFNVNSQNAIVSYDRVNSVYRPNGLQGSTVSLRIGGVGTALHVNSSANVGIGTDNPDTLLNLFGTGNTTIKVHNNDATAGTYSRLQFITGGSGSSARSEIRSLRMSSASAATNLAFFTTLAGDTSPTERLRITSSGELVSNNGTLRRNVSDSSFTVSGDTASNTGANINLYGASHSSLANVFRVRTGSTERFRITSGGNVGINRTDPDQRLNVNGNIEVNAYDSANAQGGYYTAKGLIIGNAYDAGKTTTDDRNAIIWQERGLDLDIATNDALRMKITYDGNVGIGTNNPAVKLDVRGITNVDTELKVVLDPTYNSSKNVARIIQLGYSGITGARNWALRGVFQYGGGVNVNANGGDLDLIKSLNRNTILATKTDGSPLGSVGVGTDSPSEKFHVYSTSGADLKLKIENTATNSYPTVRLTNDARSYDLQIDGATDSFRIWDGTASAQRLTVKSDGNVGIGSADPTQKLDVAGTVKATKFSGGQTDTGATTFTHVSDTTNSSMVLWGKDHTSYFGQVHIIGRSSNADQGSGGIAFYDYTGSTWDMNMFINKFGKTHIGSNVGIADGTGPGLKITRAGTRSFNDGYWMQPDGHHMLSIRSTNGADQWLTINGHYQASSGSSNILLQANFDAVAQGAGHALRSVATAAGGQQSFKLQRMYAASATNQRPTFEDIITANNDNNVGIGTVDAHAKLHVYGYLLVGPDGTKQYQGISLRNGKDSSAALSTGFIDFRNNLNTPDGHMFVDHQTNGGSTLIFGTTPAGNRALDRREERLRISENGNVGIGTNGPGAKLDVNGSFHFQSPSNYWASHSNIFFDDGANLLGSLGHHGGYELTMTSNGYRTNNSNQWASHGINSFTGAAQVALNPSGYIAFRTEANKAAGSGHIIDTSMVINGTGNVGIGTVSPASKLDVDTGSSDGTVARLYNDEVGVIVGAFGTGSSIPREATINGTRFDNGTAPALRIAGQGGIKFAVDLNSVRWAINTSGYLRSEESGYSYEFKRYRGSMPSLTADTWTTVANTTTIGDCGVWILSFGRFEQSNTGSQQWSTTYVSPPVYLHCAVGNDGETVDIPLYHMGHAQNQSAASCRLTYHSGSAHSTGRVQFKANGWSYTPGSTYYTFFKIANA